MRKLRIAGAALAAGFAVAGQFFVLAPIVLAQDGGPGPRLTFGLNQRFEANDNLDLDLESPGTSVQSRTGLSFGLSSETVGESLVFTGRTALRILDQPDTSPEYDLDATRLALGYDRSTPAAAFSLDGSYSFDQIENTLTLEDFGEGAVVPEDFGALSGTGTRNSYALGVGLSFGLDDPVGYDLTAGVSGLAYSNTSDPGLDGNTRARAGAAVRLRISPVLQARVGLSYGSFSSDDPDVEDTSNTGLDIGLTQSLPNGSAALLIFADDYSDSDDSRAGFSLSRSLQLPAGALQASLGATQLEGQSAELTGSLSWQQALPEGGLNLSLSSAVQNGSDNQPQYVTGLRAGYSRALDPLSQLGLSVTYALTEDAGSPERTEAASFRAVYSRDLTPDWSLDLGYTYQERDENSAGTARSNSVFLGLRRSWEVRP